MSGDFGYDLARMSPNMKYALIIPDGVADEPQPSLGGKTPLQAGRTPNMDAIARMGIVGQTDNVPTSMPSGSDVGTMCLFGYDPLKYHTGRAPLEAAAQGIELGPDDWAVRCNLVTIQEGKMVSFTAGQIPNDLAASLIGLMQTQLHADSPWRFYAGISYRNLLIYRSSSGPAPFGAGTKTEPPHDITDQEIAPYLPRGTGSDFLRNLMDASVSLFAQSSGNQDRVAQGQLPASGVWLWGQGNAPAMEPFIERFGKTAAVITAVDLLRGIGLLLGWRIVDVPGATGYTDTDYAAKARYTIRALDDVDLVVIHVEATDEASHEGDVAAKIEALERIDAEIVGPVHEYLKNQGDYRILVSPDHPTFLRTKTHSHGYCPFAMCGTGIQPDTAQTYDEAAAASTGLTLDEGHRLMPLFLAND